MRQLKQRFACGLMVTVHFVYALCAQAQQPIVLYGIPSNTTVQCLTVVPGGFLSAVGAVPYGVPTNVVNGLAIGSTFYLQFWPLQGLGGNWGPLESCGALNGRADIIYAIVNGCEISVGQTTSVSTGLDGTRQGFQERYSSGNRFIVLPVVDSFPDGNHNVTIRGLILAQMLDDGSGGGSSWHLQMQLLSAPPGLPNVTAMKPANPGLAGYSL